MNDFEQLERLSLVNSITKELYNHIGLQDKTLAEYLISLHEESKSFEEFKVKLNEVGAEFPESFITNMDRLVLSLHPKYQKSKSNENQIIKEDQNHLEDSQKRKDRSLFPGLAIPDVDWQPSYVPDLKTKSTSKDLNEESVDDLMNELENKRKGLQAVIEEEEEEETHNHSKGKGRDRDQDDRRGRQNLSISPPRIRNQHQDRYERERERDQGYNNRGRNQDRNHRRNPLDPKPILFKIYQGTVTSVKDYGCFVSLEGISERSEGMVHVNLITSTRINHPSDLVSRNQKVKVKVMSIVGTRLSLSMKDVDQNTGADLSPQLRIKSEAEMAEEAAQYAARHATGANSTSTSKTFADDHRSSARRLTSPERWEIKQMIASGAASAADYPNLDDDLITPGSTMGMAAAAQAEEELDVEIREDEAPFLKGAHRRVLDLSPVKILKKEENYVNKKRMKERMPKRKIRR
ncbi:uncharacterized protein MELLADRAFT_93831 [Melampsora larici-populina 98AG31]|uniref:S1 motif domain-containing protein n=1 Tax=Melampsora larici-populina (strain 98AG31 / pathotype 3-4-7) TaxID=747676 RepID=F4S5E8_MELLP|nr:uncharacterized protein MELLADRAFT_93831 [Melampsora larici-populina 98AG31]EGG00156.1 hypothetical protein MELLADRAFT_93831 [Melampsora larici-populina 98AG31]